MTLSSQRTTSEAGSFLRISIRSPFIGHLQAFTTHAGFAVSPRASKLLLPLDHRQYRVDLPANQRLRQTGRDPALAGQQRNIQNLDLPVPLPSLQVQPTRETYEIQIHPIRWRPGS